jgi:hypothetical protein
MIFRHEQRAVTSDDHPDGPPVSIRRPLLTSCRHRLTFAHALPQPKCGHVDPDPRPRDQTAEAVREANNRRYENGFRFLFAKLREKRVR